MKWMSKSKGNTNTDDMSRELKNGDVKGILINEFSISVPEFSFIRYQDSTYYFSRVKGYKGNKLYETLSISYSLKGKSFDCSISSCFNKKYELSHALNIGTLNPNIRLKVLINENKVSNIKEAYYFHDDNIYSVKNAVSMIANDYKKHGLQYLEDRFCKLEHDLILNTGLDYISNLKVNHQTLNYELNDELLKAKYMVSRVKQPQFVELKTILKKTPYGTKEYKQYIPKLSYELLELYCNNYSIVGIAKDI
ncbi:hypothetical protein JK636_18845 [Clostridium sp. YIM B02515]|uniref:Uncharacterized protein n=1 Tax=Clostridium rhizosphaerae TaxID=2803861 RepID=A0ABS1TFA7_9CLOT|nr:hypothetical protein [Clostridium rhizosphaerae]MBL4937767.1 hypothetical protein [Clostridium rhizosphaerae]